MVFELESPRILSLHSVIIEFPFWKDVICYAHIPDLKYKGAYLLRPYIGNRYTIPWIYAKVYSSIGLKLTISFLQQHEYFKYQGVKNHFGSSLVSISPHVKFLTQRSKNSKKFGEKNWPQTNKVPFSSSNSSIILFSGSVTYTLYICTTTSMWNFMLYVRYYTANEHDFSLMDHNLHLLSVHYLFLLCVSVLGNGKVGVNF